MPMGGFQPDSIGLMHGLLKRSSGSTADSA